VDSKIKLDNILTNCNEKYANWTAAVWSDDQGDGFLNSSYHQFVDFQKYLVRKILLKVKKCLKTFLADPFYFEGNTIIDRKQLR